MHSQNCGYTIPFLHNIKIYLTIIDSTYNPVDPPVAPTIGFFLNDNGWLAKTFVAPDVVSALATSLAATDSLKVNLNNVITKCLVMCLGIIPICGWGK
ncbi:MAG: hypothetical protein WDM90_21930 [Ferruginibacter sp.]